MGNAKGRRTRFSSVLGVSIAVGVLLAVTALAASASAAPLARPTVLGTTHKSCGVGDDPFQPGYDPVTKEMYVPNGGSGNITVLRGTCTVAGTIKLPKGAVPIQAIFDPANNYMFVTDDGLNQIYEISGLKVHATINNTVAGGVLTEPYGIAWAPPNGGVLVITNLHGIWNSVWVYLTPTGPFVQAAELASHVTSAEGIAYDPADGDFWVTLDQNDSVIATEASDFFVDSRIVPVGSDPSDVAYDSANSDVYVTNSDSSNVSVLTGGTGKVTVVGTISGFDDPNGITWDQANLSMYVANFGNGKVYEVGGKSGLAILKRISISSTAFPFYIAYDESNDDLYVTQGLGDTVYVLT